MAYFEQFKQLDAQLLYSGTIAATGVGSAIDTTWYGNIVVQVSGNGTIQATIEGSNDQTNWFTITLNNLNDLSVVDTIYSDGGYQFKTTYQYIRYNVANYTGTQTLAILGRSGPGASAADNLAAAFNPDTPINVSLQNIKKDAAGALMLSDSIPYNLYGNNTYVFDATGYASIVIFHQNGPTTTVTQSIDGVTWFPVNFSTPGSTTLTNVLVGANLYTGGVVGKYIRAVVSGATTTSIPLLFKQAPASSYVNVLSMQPVNIGGVGGTTPVSGGVAGTLGVGGNIAAGGSSTANPVTIGGTDPGNLLRRIQSDMFGRPAITAASPYFHNYNSNSPQANSAYPINAVGAIPATYQQVGALAVQETNQYEGQGRDELLAQILLELRILNQQMYELPRLIANQQASNDPPELFRQEPSIFSQ